MICTPLPGGGFVCHRGRRQTCTACGKVATLQCDYPVQRRARGGDNVSSAPKPGTCDRWICTACAAHVGPDRDYCPPHKRLADAQAVAAGAPGVATTPASTSPPAVPPHQLRLL